MRKSTAFLVLLLAFSLAASGLLFVHPRLVRDKREKGTAEMLQMVRELELTDLCLFTEARYTRHLTQADLNSAFGDHPAALEHFPSGSLAAPPPHLVRSMTADHRGESR